MGCAAWLAVTSHGHWCSGAFSLPWRGFKDGSVREGNPAEPRQRRAAHAPLRPHPGSAALRHVTLHFSARGHRMSVPFALPLLSFPLNMSRFKLLSGGRAHLRALLAPHADRSEFLLRWRRFQLCFYLKVHVSTKHIALKGPLACAASSAAISSTMMWWILAVKALVLSERRK